MENVRKYLPLIVGSLVAITLFFVSRKMRKGEQANTERYTILEKAREAKAAGKGRRIDGSITGGETPDYEHHSTTNDAADKCARNKAPATIREGPPPKHHEENAVCGADDYQDSSRYRVADLNERDD